MVLRTRTLVPLALALLLVAPGTGFADPPSHAPAHGYRAKQGKHAKTKRQEPKNGIEVVYDSERGIHIAVGLPGIFFHEGRYYREHEGHWQMSLRGDGDWRIAADAVPDVVVRAGRHGAPGPAKAGGPKHAKKKR